MIDTHDHYIKKIQLRNKKKRPPIPRIEQKCYNRLHLYQIVTIVLTNITSQCVVAIGEVQGLGLVRRLGMPSGTDPVGA